MSVTEGLPAPALDLPTDDGGRVSTTGLRGRWAVVFFYPKADTPGCTNEARDFSALLPRFEALGATVVGVSKDAPRKLARFREKHGLTVALAGDDAEMIEAWGLWVEKQLYGRKYMGIERATVLVDPEGVVRRVWRTVKVAGHADEVLAALATEGDSQA